MKILRIAIVCASVLIILASPSFAGGGREAAGKPQEDDFLQKLNTELQENGYSEQEAAEIITAAREMDWSKGDKTDPSVIARSVAATRENGDQLTGQDRAEIARAVAENAEELENEGYSRSEVANATLAGTEKLRAQIKEWHESGRTGELGEMVRSTVRDTIRARTPDQGEGPPEGVPGGPQETPGRSDDRGRPSADSNRGSEGNGKPDTAPAN
jgi:hypothetical protein